MEISRTGDRKRACRILVGRTDGKRPVGRTRPAWEDIIKMDLQEVEWGDMVLVALAVARDRWRVLVNTVMSLRIP